MIKNVVFDVGRVLIEWDAKNLYRKVFENDAEIDEFLDKIGFWEWNLSMDKGKSFEQGVAEKQKEFPEYAEEIAMFDTRWEESVPDLLAEPVEVLRDIKRKGYPVYALTNFSTEKFKLMLERFDFFDTFDGIVVSAEEDMLKPDPRFFNLMCDRYALNPSETVFIDDNEGNVDSAKSLGFETILFKYPDLLRPQLQKLGLDL